MAVCLMNSIIGTAGLPHTVAPAGTSRMTPLLPAIRAPVPTCKLLWEQAGCDEGAEGLDPQPAAKGKPAQAAAAQVPRNPLDM